MITAEIGRDHESCIKMEPNFGIRNDNNFQMCEPHFSADLTLDMCIRKLKEIVVGNPSLFYFIF